MWRAWWHKSRTIGFSCILTLLLVQYNCFASYHPTKVSKPSGTLHIENSLVLSPHSEYILLDLLLDKLLPCSLTLPVPRTAWALTRAVYTSWQVAKLQTWQDTQLRTPVDFRDVGGKVIYLLQLHWHAASPTHLNRSTFRVTDRAYWKHLIVGEKGAPTPPIDEYWGLPTVSRST